MIRKLLFLLLIPVSCFGQVTTWTGVIRDTSNAIVTSGKVNFTLAPSTDATIPGSSRFVATTTSCTINSDGTLGIGTGACVTTMNTALSPTGTSYKICIQPYFAQPGSCFYGFAVLASQDITTQVPTPSTGPFNYNPLAQGLPGPQGPPGSPGAGCGITNCTTALLPYGSLANFTTFTSLTGFVPNAATPTVSGGQLHFTGGAQNFSQSLDWNYDTTLPEWTMTSTIVAGTPSSTSAGVGLGIRSYNAGGALYITVANVDLTNTANAGFLFIYQNDGQAGGQSPTKITFSAGDSIRLTFVREFDTFTATASNITTGGAPVTATFRYQFYYAQTKLSPNRGKFALYNFGGSQGVSSFSISSVVPKGVDLMCVGDSKTVSYYVGSYGDGYCTKLTGYLRTVNESGGSDETADVLAVIPELVALKPKAVLLNIGRNDIGRGVPFSTYSVNYASIVSQLVAAGISVYHLLPLYEPGLDQGPLDTFIRANYPSNFFDGGLQAYSATPSTVLSPDAVHPNSFGHQVITDAAVRFLFGTNVAVQPPPYISKVIPRMLVGQIGVDTSGAYNFGYGLPQTDTTANKRVGSLGQSSDIANPWALVVSVTGHATPALRKFNLQTEQDLSSNAGILSLQENGGSLFGPTVALGDNSPSLATTAFIAFNLPKIYDAGGTQYFQPHIVLVQGSLIAGTITVNFTGSAIFAANLYNCNVQNRTNNAGLNINRVSGSQVQIGDSGSGTEAFDLTCIGR